MFRNLTFVVLLSILSCASAAELMAQDFAMFAQAPERVAAGAEATTSFEATVAVLASNLDSELGVRAWSVSVRADNGTISAADTVGTVAADREAGGLLDNGFELTQITEGADNEGAVSAVVLSFTEAVSLPEDVRSDVLRLTIEAASPDRDCQGVGLRFVDGLRGQGEPVLNAVVYEGIGQTPTLEGSETQVCSVPSIEVSPTDVNFGQIIEGERATARIEISNRGRGVLTLGTIELTPDSSSDMKIDALPDVDEIASGASISIILAYEPTELGRSQGQLLIQSDDPEQPIAAVSLEGVATALPTPQISVDREAIVFDEILLGESNTADRTLSNSGQATLEVASISISGEGFSLLSTPGPASLEPESDMSIQIEFAPVNAGDVSGTLTIESDDPASPRIEIEIRASAVEPLLPQFKRGDTNADGSLNLTDAVVTLLFLFRAGDAPVCPDSADTDDNGAINLTDAVFMLNWLFRSGPDISAPGTQSCGEDPSDDGLVACEYPAASC